MTECIFFFVGIKIIHWVVARNQTSVWNVERERKREGGCMFQLKRGWWWWGESNIEMAQMIERMGKWKLIHRSLEFKFFFVSRFAVQILFGVNQKMCKIIQVFILALDQCFLIYFFDRDLPKRFGIFRGTVKKICVPKIYLANLKNFAEISKNCNLSGDSFENSSKFTYFRRYFMNIFGQLRRHIV